MLGLGLSQVKIEPPSEDDDISQLSCNYYSDPLPPYDVRPLKLDTETLRPDDVQNNLLQLQELQVANGLEELSLVAPAGPAATPVCVKQEPADAPPPPATFETLETPANPGPSLMERQMSMLSQSEEMSEFMPLMPVKEEPSSEGESTPHSEDTFDPPCEYTSRGHKSWTQEDMDAALNALKTQNMSLTKASARFGIPSTTLWQRAHRAGIDTPKREHTARAWTPRDLSTALAMLRLGRLSANKASKAYGIPSSTLYKIARREGIRLSAPFNAAPTSWRRADLSRALDAIRAGDSVQRAATHYRIPTGTLYGRCKREGIELSRSNPTPWSEDAMREALEAVRVGQMSINQAAIHYNLPYSSLYGRFKRCKYQIQNTQALNHTNVQEIQELEPQVHQELYYQQQMPQESNYHQYDAQHTLMHNTMIVDDQTYPDQVMYYARGDGVVS